MAGHSKWSNIKHKKGKQMPHAVIYLPKSGEKYLSQLNKAVLILSAILDLEIIAKAKQANMPNDNINRSIKKLVVS